MGAGLTALPAFMEAMASLPDVDIRMPALFVGHGSPMNAVAENSYTRALSELGTQLPRPKAILVISAHWLSRGSYVTGAPKPPTIHDFYGFPEELYQIDYPAPGTPGAAKMTMELLKKMDGMADMRRGLDHGAWAVLLHMYPDADVPVYQLSIDRSRSMDEMYLIGRMIRELRDKGILIVGSGNITHNLGKIDPDENAPAYAWAEEFDAKVANFLSRGDHKALTQYESWGEIARLAHPSDDHYIPLIYTTGVVHDDEPVEYFHEGFQHGSISMRCVKFG